MYYIEDAAGVLSGPVELPEIPGLGMQVPSNAIELENELPAPKPGHAWVMVDGHPDQLADHRGEVYSTETGEAQQHDALGDLPAGLTTEQRPSGDHSWSGSGWVFDAELHAKRLQAEAQAQRQQIDVERDRRIDAGVEFQGVMFQSRATDRENIAGAAQLGFMAVVAGAQTDDLRWSSPVQDFAWIASDNTLVPMDAQTVVAFGKAAAERKQALIFAARQLKDMESIPVDYTEDKWWP